ncbi:MAG TPA: hypothetical protein VGQ76_09835 [Thermoanaerobaculia bacterium]|nr:hypothetical protein [Thermoanaerobaculia bacterium]
MKRTKRCGECGTSNIRTTTVSAGGGYAPDLLPGAHPWWKGAVLEVYVCCTCGHFQYFVPEAALQGVIESKKFRPLA